MRELGGHLRSWAGPDNLECSHTSAVARRHNASHESQLSL
jgi:hypothetical protein